MKPARDPWDRHVCSSGKTAEVLPPGDPHKDYSSELSLFSTDVFSFPALSAVSFFAGFAVSSAFFSGSPTVIRSENFLRVAGPMPLTFVMSSGFSKGPCLLSPFFFWVICQSFLIRMMGKNVLKFHFSTPDDLFVKSYTNMSPLRDSVDPTTGL